MRGTVMAAGGRVVVGTRVYCGLYGGNYGIVYGIHGEQAPESIGSLGGVMSYGGRADFDIAFDNHLSRRVPECIVRGVQWKIFTEVATADDIVELISKANAFEAAKKVEAEAAAVRRAAERVKHAADNPHLLKAADRPNWSENRRAAENVRRELKRAFPKTKFTVRLDGNVVNVGWTDGPTASAVKSVVDKFESGSFNGMEDIYESNDDATFADVFGGVKFVSESREATVEGVRTAWVKAKDDPARPGHCGWGSAEDVTTDWRTNPRRDDFWRTWAAFDLTAA